MPAPVMSPSRPAGRSAAGAAIVPFLPRNSCRLPVWALTGSLMAWNASHDANCGS